MDFVACHDEKIHIPGYIQDFGYLIGLHAATKQIKFLSENVSEIFPLNTSFLTELLMNFQRFSLLFWILQPTKDLMSER